ESSTQRHTCDGELATRTEVRLEEHADRVLAVPIGHESRGRARSALELVAVHARAAADRAFVDRARECRLERLHADRLGHVVAIDVIEIAVPGLAGDREEPRFGEITVVSDGPGDYRGVDDADGVRVGDPDRPAERARLLDP